MDIKNGVQILIQEMLLLHIGNMYLTYNGYNACSATEGVYEQLLLNFFLIDKALCQTLKTFLCDAKCF